MIFHSDGSVYSHGRPSSDVYTINLKKLKMFLIGSFATTSNEGITGIAFLATRHDYLYACEYGPVGVKPGDYKVKLGSTTGFYGSINEQGIIKLGYHGCIPPQ